MELERNIQFEALRLNQRFEANKANPAWTEEALNILITATHDMYDLNRQFNKDIRQVIFANNFHDPTLPIPLPPFKADRGPIPPFEDRG